MKSADRALSNEIISKPTQFVELHASLNILVKDIAAILEKNFPGWQWMIQPDQRGQVINIFNNHLSGEWGYTIRTVEIHNDPKRRLAYKAGREILERFGLQARGLSGQERDVANLPRGRDGEVKPKHAWDRMTRQQREQAIVDESADDMEQMIARLMADG